MNTIHNANFNIAIKKLQEILENNYTQIGLTKENCLKIIKILRKRNITKPMRFAFYDKCLKLINHNMEYKKGKQLTFDDRQTIELLKTAGFSKSFIAIFLNKNRSTISREINSKKYEIINVYSIKSPRKHSGNEMIEVYNAKISQKICDENKVKNRKKFILDNNLELQKTIVALLKNGRDTDNVRYSPEAISALSNQGKIIGTTTSISSGVIYRAVRQRKYGLTINDLPHGRHYYKSENKYSKIYVTPERKKEHSIDIMPEHIKEKKSDDHWEGDSVIGKKEGTNNTIITLVHVKSKFLIIKRSKDKTAQSFVNVLDELEIEVQDFNQIIATLLLDNGVEFSFIKSIMRSKYDPEKMRLMVYYAHAYASYERGLNENTNRLVRRDILKGTLIENYTDEKLLNVAKKINNMPRKSLGWKTSLEVLEDILNSRDINIGFLDKYRIPLCKYLIA